MKRGKVLHMIAKMRINANLIVETDDDILRAAASFAEAKLWSFGHSILLAFKFGISIIW